MVNTEQRKQDPIPFFWAMGGFFSLLGGFMYKLSGLLWFLGFSGLGIGIILFPLFKMKSLGVHDAATRKKNMIIGTIVFIFSAVVVWITIENRFNLETMAQTKSI